MSSYFGHVPLADAVQGSLEKMRASGVVAGSTYLGIAPELTTVLYAPHDKLGLASALASLVPIGLCVALLTVFMSRRTAEDLWVGVGQVGCEIVNGILKLIIKEPRPSSPVTNMPVDSYGMPSAHAQYMGYFAAIIIIQTMYAPSIGRLHRAARILGVSALSMFTAFSRYYLYYHSGPQVVYGFLVGVVLGVAWLLMAHVARQTGLMAWCLSLWPCRMMMVKDVKYSVEAEYREYLRLQNKFKSE